MTAVVHVAAKPVGMVQRCERCGIVLIDRNNEHVIASTGLAPRWWSGNVEVEGGTQSATTDTPNCTLRGH